MFAPIGRHPGATFCGPIHSTSGIISQRQGKANSSPLISAQVSPGDTVEIGFELNKPVGMERGARS